MSLFATAFLQVTLVSMNVIFISRGAVFPMLLTGFGISFVWTLNVKKIAFSRLRERLLYATGAMCGTYVGYLITTFI
jgi:hypothetical protein